MNEKLNGYIDRPMDVLYIQYSLINGLIKWIDIIDRWMDGWMDGWMVVNIYYF